MAPGDDYVVIREAVTPTEPIHRPAGPLHYPNCATAGDRIRTWVAVRPGSDSSPSTEDAKPEPEPPADLRHPLLEQLNDSLIARGAKRTGLPFPDAADLPWE